VLTVVLLLLLVTAALGDRGDAGIDADDDFACVSFVMLSVLVDRVTLEHHRIYCDLCYIHLAVLLTVLYNHNHTLQTHPNSVRYF